MRTKTLLCDYLVSAEAAIGEMKWFSSSGDE